MIQLFYTPLSIDDAFAYLQTETAGAVDIFVGTTRRFTAEQETQTLFYEAYEEMALLEMQKLADKAHEQWEIERLLMWHRLGEVPLAQASVIIGVSTKHRAASFEATRFLIDELKKTVPIWKKEHFANGNTKWI
jgi:molybdopterin synthase catalytic subunit